MRWRVSVAALLCFAWLCTDQRATHAERLSADACGYRSHMWAIVQTASNYVTAVQNGKVTSVSQETQYDSDIMDRMTLVDVTYGVPAPAAGMDHVLIGVIADMDTAADLGRSNPLFGEYIQKGWQGIHGAWRLLKNVSCRPAARQPAPGGHAGPSAKPRPQPRTSGPSLFVQAWVSPNSMPYDFYPALYAKSIRGATCSASVVYSTGRSPVSFSGYPQTVGSSGTVSWSWHEETIGSGGVADVTCTYHGRNRTAEATFTVTG